MIYWCKPEKGYMNHIDRWNTKLSCLYFTGWYDAHIVSWLPALFLVVTVTLRTLTVRPRSTLHHGWSSKLLKKHDFLWESGLGLESTANWGFRSPNTLLLEVGLPLARSVPPKDIRELLLNLTNWAIYCIRNRLKMKSRAPRITFCQQIIKLVMINSS